MGREPRLRDDGGSVLLGDDMMADWRRRTERGTARVRSYYDVIPDRESRLTLESSLKNRWGDPLPHLDFRDAPESVALRGYTEDRLRALFQRMADAGTGRVLSSRVDSTQDHPGGGCRMGDDPETSVVDSYGRTHDHENLFVVGAPTVVTGGCNNGTLTFSALALRSATEIARMLPTRTNADA